MAKDQEQVNTASSQTSADKLRKILKEEKRMKKKRKRSTSSTSSSSSSSDSSSSTTSSSSSHCRSKKKKKKKKHKASKRRRRTSLKDSRKSNQNKRSKQEDEDIEWYPAPPLTSATFLNQSGGPGFRVKDVFAKYKDGQNRRENEREEENRKDDGGTWLDSDSRRRDSLEGKRRVSSSSADSEYSRRSCLHGENSKYSRNNESRRGSLDSGKYETGNGRKTSGSCTKVEDKAQPEGPKKALPTNLLDIFNQIEQFEKEKGVRPKK